ncbi:MAG: fructosamine kinase family protein [Agriterribacter sp.]
MLDHSLLQHIQQKLSTYFSEDILVSGYQPVYGGDINEAYTLKTNQGNFFLKVNNAADHADMFDKEAKGLTLLLQANCLRVPKPLMQDEYEERIFLLTEYIVKGKPSGNFWETFGEQLAKLHQQSHDYFGLGYDNYIGSLPQHNNPHNNWSDFYAQRILLLAQKAFDLTLLERRHIAIVEKFPEIISNIFPVEKPSLLHGDLWSGNFMANEEGMPVIFDPAVYYGHREMDIAMSLLFGGFDRKLYRAYHYFYPLQTGWETRVQLCQLNPLLVHLVLFGGHYREKVVGILEKCAQQ